jgi:hypothetical protein
MSGIRYCRATDGLFSKTDEECLTCFRKHRQICQVFSIYLGFRDIDYFVDYDFSDNEKKFTDLSTLVDKLRRSKGSI